MSRILVTGATGFVGRALSQRLLDTPHEVRCGSRNADDAAARFPDRTWTHFDLDDEASIDAALADVEVAYYLVHGMGSGEGYAQRERTWAIRFIDAAERAGVQRVIYLGGVEPENAPSPHLASRLDTGLLLRRRSEKTQVLELRAGMIIGDGSESWCIVRDLASRLPAMVLPRWLENRSQPVALADVVEALVHGATDDAAGVYGIPGPDTMTGEEILRRAARLRGIRPICVKVPFISQRLSSHWIRWVTRADPDIATELVQGMSSDLVCHDTPYWSRMPDFTPMSFEPAARRALEAEDPTLPLKTRVTEGLIRAIARAPSAES